MASRGEKPGVLDQRDLQSRISERLVRLRARQPGWHQEALRVLAVSEARSVVMLEAALPNVSDRTLRRLITQHLEDERNHDVAFSTLCGDQRIGKSFAARGSQSGRMSLMDLMAFFEVAEVRGYQTMVQYRDIFADRPEVLETIGWVLRDERFHATYTRRQMDMWAAAGLADEVRRARRRARWRDRISFLRQMAAFLLDLPRILAARPAHPQDAPA